MYGKVWKKEKERSVDKGGRQKGGKMWIGIDRKGKLGMERKGERGGKMELNGMGKVCSTIFT